MLKSIKKWDYASIVLSVLSLILLFLNQFMFFSRTRVDAKNGLTALESFGSNYYIILNLTILLVILIFIRQLYIKSSLDFLIAFIASLNFGLVIYFSGGTFDLLQIESESARVSLSLGAYGYLILMYLILGKSRTKLSILQSYLTLIPMFGITIYSITSGKIDNLSIMREYYAREDQFKTEFVKHIQMVLAVVITAIIIGVPAGWYSVKNRWFNNITSIILSTIQSIPSIAFMFLLMFPLAFINRNVPGADKLGISGIGAAPVFLGLLFYALFHIVNNVYSAIKNIDDNYIEVAKGMGMSDFQILLKVQLPIASPVIISGIHLATIVTISAATLGAFAGFGGLGFFIVQGSSGFAVDLILLGALPIVFMILLTSWLKNIVVYSITGIMTSRRRVNR